jgi:large subunit ribosomal protein L10
MPSLEKELMYDEIKERFDGRSVFISSFDRLKISDFEALRKSVRSAKGAGFVVKKTLLKRYLSDSNVKDFKGLLEGALFLSTCQDEPQKLSKALTTFAKGNQNFVVRGAYAEGSLQGKDYVEALAKLPSREQLLASLLGGMKAPITNFVFGLNAILRNFVVVVDQIKQQKEGQSS